MEYICEVCQKKAKVFCSCDTSHQYCYRDFVKVHLKTNGKHNEIDIATRKEEINQKFLSTIESLKKIKMEIISRSNEMIRIIQIITKSKLSNIKKYIDCCSEALITRDLDTQKIFKDYQNIETREAEFESFKQITIKNFSIFQDGYEIINLELQKALIETKPEILKFSKNLKEIQRPIKRPIQTNFNSLLQGHTGSVSSVAVTNDNKYVISCSNDSTIRIWNLLELKQEAVLEGQNSSYINCVTVSKDNKYFITGCRDKLICIWNLLELKQEAVLEGHLNGVTTVAVTSDNTYIVSGSFDNTVRIWNLLEKKQETVLEGHTSYIYCVVVTSNNKYIISGFADTTIRVWNPLQKSEETVLKGHLDRVNCVALTSDNKYIISGSSDKTLRIWNLLEKRQETVLQGHLDGVSSVALTSDNKYIISGSYDRAISIWNFLEKRQEAVLEGHTSYIHCITVTSDNKYIVSGSADSTIRIWNLLEKKQKAFFNSDDSINLLDKKYNSTIYSNNGQAK